MGERLQNLIQGLVQLPRLIRIIIAVFFAGMMTLAVSPLVDHIYLRYFFSIETRILPAFVTVAIASIMYIAGWRIYIGTVNTVPSAKNRILWYFGMGISVTIIVIVLFIQGISMAQ